MHSAKRISGLLGMAILVTMAWAAPVQAKELELLHPDFDARLGVKVIVEVGEVSAGVSMKAELTNGRGLKKIVASKSGKLDKQEIVTLDFRKLPAAEYTLTISLSDGRKAIRTWKKPYDGIPRVGLNENNSLCVEGKLFFPVTCKGVNGANIKKWAPYINTLKHLGFDKKYFTPQGFKKWLDDAQAQGLMAIGPGRAYYWPNGGAIWRSQTADGYKFDQKIDDEKMKEFIKVARKHPAFLMYEWKDEPDIGGGGQFIPPAEVRRWTEISHELDPQHLVFCNVMGFTFGRKLKTWHSNQAQKYTYLYGEARDKQGNKTLIADVISMDYYPIEDFAPKTNKNPMNKERMCLAMDRMVQWNGDAAMFMACVETCDIKKPNTPAPTPDEVYFLAWANIIHGAKGISWFHYFRPTPEENFKKMKFFKEQVIRLTPAVLGPNYEGEVTCKTPNEHRVDVLARTGPDGVYLFTANILEKDTSAEFTVKGMPDQNVVVVDEDRTIPMKNGIFKDTYKSNDVHIYRIPKTSDKKVSRIETSNDNEFLFSPKQMSGRALTSAKPKNLYKKWKNGPSNDLRYFPLGVSTQNPRFAERFRNAGINMYVRLWDGPTEAQLRELAKCGMETACNMNELGLRYAQKAGQKSLIKMWHLGDEPDNAQSTKRFWSRRTEKELQTSWPGLADRTAASFGTWGPPIPPQWKIREYQEWVKKDPTRPVRLNLGYGVAYEQFKGRGIRTGKLDDYKEYVKACDIASFDIYPVNEADVRGKLWVQALGVKRLREWTQDKKPIWNYVEGCQISTKGRKPTFEEIRSQVWISLIHGSDGIVYFGHGNHPQTGKFWDQKLAADEEQLKVIGRVNKEVLSVARALNHEDIEGVVRVHSSTPASDELKKGGLDPIAVVAKSDGKDIYIFSARMEETPATGRFTLQKGPQSGTLEVLNENRTVKIKNGQFHDEFKGYGVHLYRLNK